MIWLGRRINPNIGHIPIEGAETMGTDFIYSKYTKRAYAVHVGLELAAGALTGMGH